MKNKRILAILSIAAVFSVAAAGCMGEEEPEQVVVEETPTPEPTQTPTPEPTIAPDVQDTTYTSSTGAISIRLPDATWANKTDEEDIVSFESPKQGRILIVHGAGEEDLSSVLIPDTQDLAVSLEQANDLTEGTDFEIQNFNAEEVNGVRVYSYTVHYMDSEKSGGYEYALNKYFVNDGEYYSITGSVASASSLAGVSASVESFAMDSSSTLSAAAPISESKDKKKSSDDQENTEEASGTAESAGTEESTGTAEASESSGTTGNSGGFTQEQLTDTNQTRTLYRNSDGHPIVVTPDGNGNWKDFDGNTYRFVNDEDVYDQNDVDYYWHGEGADVYYMPVE